MEPVAVGRSHGLRHASGPNGIGDPGGTRTPLSVGRIFRDADASESTAKRAVGEPDGERTNRNVRDNTRIAS